VNPVGKVARRLVGRNYNASKRYALWQMRRVERPVVVFSMGKTGSTAISRAVQDATGRPALQVFRLVPDRLAQAEARYRVNQPHGPFRGAHHLWESEHLLRHPPGERAPWTVITTVREPVAQAVSAFFHGSERRDLLRDAPPVESLLDALISEQWVREPLRWFEREFEPALGIDALAEPFDVAAGYSVIETPAVRVLLLRQENFDAAPEALGRFLGLDRPVPVPARNEAVTKGYGGRYGEFLASVRMPDALLDKAYRSHYSTHFYAESELARFRQRWHDGVEPSAASRSRSPR
jgi:Putative capsular polysaccharide synthesis protein